MNINVIILSGNYHFGDNPGVFQDATYVGLSLELPITIDLSGTENLGDAGFIFETHDVETWTDQGCKGHQVCINGVEIGRIADPNDRFGRAELFRIPVYRDTLKELMGGEDYGKVVLKITAETLDKSDLRVDDFVLTRIEAEGFAACIGCR